MTTIDPKHFERLIELLNKKPIEIYHERKNTGVGRSLPFGIINRRNYGLGRCRNNRRYPEHYAEMVKLAELINPDVKYTSFMLNDNYSTPPHKDKNNDGTSCIVGFGDYIGGELNVQGRLYNIKYTPLHMDASTQSHCTEPWSGKRYSFVMFRIKLNNKISKKYEEWDFKMMNDALGEYEDADSNHKLD